MTAERAGILDHRLAELRDRADDRFAIDVVDDLAQVDVRTDPGGALAAGLPVEPNTFVRRGERITMWLGPDEWLVVAPGDGGTLVAELDDALAPAHRSVLDVSANRVVVELAGTGVEEVLANECPIDLHPRVWTLGRCAQTLVMGVPAVLARRDDRTHVLVRPSYAEHVVERLLDAAGLVEEGLRGAN